MTQNGTLDWEASFIIGYYRSNKKNIIPSLLKFAGYIHNHKILPGNIFGLILKKQDGHQGCLFDLKQELLLAL